MVIRLWSSSTTNKDLIILLQLLVTGMVQLDIHLGQKDLQSPASHLVPRIMILEFQHLMADHLHLKVKIQELHLNFHSHLQDTTEKILLISLVLLHGKGKRKKSYTNKDLRKLDEPEMKK